MGKVKLFKGGEFLITDAEPHEVFSPEDFTQEQRLLGKSAEEFGLGEVAPRRDELEELNPDLIKSLLRKAGDLGLLGTDIPEVYGGSELEKVGSILVTERINQGIGTFMVSYAAQTAIGSLPIVFFGSPKQKKKYLPKLATGELMGCYALTEPEHGSDALRAETTAVLSEDGKYYILNGQKQFITNAGFADIIITYGQVESRGFTSFIVERDWEGVSVDEEEKKMGFHGASTRPVIFQNVKVPVENVLGEVGCGHVVALNTLNVARFKLAAGILGIAKVLIAEGVRYAKGRIQFGKPICEFGLIKHKIAEMVIRVYVTESMIYRTAGLIDKALEEIDSSGESATNRTGEVLRRYALECSVNKVLASEMLDYVADECLQIMGGYGYVQGNLVESSYRDARINRIWDGTSEINRLAIVGQLLKDSERREIPVFEVIKGIETHPLAISRAELTNIQGALESERILLRRAKQMFLLSVGAATRNGDQFPYEQEVIGMLADMVIGIFAMESVFLRTLKKIKKEGEEKSRASISAARVYFNDSFPKLDLMAKQVFGASFENEKLITQLETLRELGYYTPVNTVMLRREIAESIIPVARYPLTRL